MCIRDRSMVQSYERLEKLHPNESESRGRYRSTKPEPVSYTHLVGGTLLAILIGPYAASLALTVALLLQAFLFGDGGIPVSYTHLDVYKRQG